MNEYHQDDLELFHTLPGYCEIVNCAGKVIDNNRDVGLIFIGKTSGKITSCHIVTAKYLKNLVNQLRLDELPR